MVNNKTPPMARNNPSLPSQYENPAEDRNGEENRLPFDPWSLLIAVGLRWRWLVLFTGISVCLGVAAGLSLGSKTFVAQTVILCKPVSNLPRNEFQLSSPLEGDTVMSYRLGGPGGEPELNHTNLETFRNMVKIPSNLEEVRRRLSLPISTSELGRLCDVIIQKNTSLMTLTAQADTAQQAADIANTLRDVFFENQNELRRNELKGQMQLVQRRLQQTTAQWEKADAGVQAFITQNRVIDINEELKLRLSEIASLDALYDSALQDRNASKLKVDNANQKIKELQEKVQSENAKIASSQNVQDLSIRVERLRDAIHDDTQYRANQADLVEKEAEYKRYQNLFNQGMVPRAEFEKVKSAYEKQQVLTLDTPQTKQWKKEIEELQKGINPENKEKAPSTSMLQDMMVRVVDFELDYIAAEERLIYFENKRNLLKSDLNQLPALQRQYAQLSRAANAKEAEKRSLEDMLQQIQHEIDADLSDFQVPSVAKPPVFPISSDRRVMSAGVTILGTGFGFVLVLGLVLLDTRIRSASELAGNYVIRCWALFPGWPIPPISCGSKTIPS